MKPPGAAMVASSPGRDKLPPVPAPGLARLFGGSRSRGRSSASARSSPMFVSRSRSVGRSSAASKTPAGGATDGGEPSSPKVTCIGQVRMRNKRPSSSAANSSSSTAKKAQSPSKKVSSAPLMHCRCLQKVLMCSIFPSARKKPKDLPNDARRSLWRNWSSFSGKTGGSAGTGTSSGNDGYHHQKLDPAKLRPELIPRSKEADFHRIKVEDEEEEEAEETSEHEGERKVFVSSSATSTPPKNALLLMRCRSAPHNRESTLAIARFAVSPLPLSFESTEPKPEDIAGHSVMETGEWKEEEEEGKKRKSRDRDTPTSPASAAADEYEEDEEEEEEEDEKEEEEEEEGTGSESQRPLVLERSKSVPARVEAAELAAPGDAAAAGTHCFWKNGSSSTRWQRRRWGLLHEERTPQSLVPLSVCP